MLPSVAAFAGRSKCRTTVTDAARVGPRRPEWSKVDFAKTRRLPDLARPGYSDPFVVERGVMPVKITDVEVYPVKGRHWPRFPMVFIEVRTNVGIVGLGEPLHYHTSGLIESLRDAGDYLVGKDP